MSILMQGETAQDLLQMEFGNEDIIKKKQNNKKYIKVGISIFVLLLVTKVTQVVIHGYTALAQQKKQKPINLAQVNIRNMITSQSYNITISQLKNGMQFRRILRRDNQTAIKNQLNYSITKYQIDKYQELPICFMCFFENDVQQKFLGWAIKQIMIQNYTNYQAVVIDNYYKNIKQKINSLKLVDDKFKDKIRIIKTENAGQSIAKIISQNALKYCPAHSIVVQLNGINLLNGKQNFKIINSIFQRNSKQEQIWFAWFNAINNKQRAQVVLSYPKLIRQNRWYRKSPYLPYSTKAYYLDLLKLVNPQDLKNENGQYHKYGDEQALHLPMLEMAGAKHSKYIPEILYLEYRDLSGYKSFPDLPDFLMKKQPYPLLSSLDF